MNSDVRVVESENATICIDRQTPEPTWMRCTESQWEKKAELSIRSGELGEAMKYSDYANCVSLYEAGFTVTEIQNRFSYE